MSSKDTNTKGPKEDTLRVENEVTPRRITAQPLPSRNNVSAIASTVASAPEYEDLESVQLISGGPLMGARYSRDPQNDRDDPPPPYNPGMADAAVGLDGSRLPNFRYITLREMWIADVCCGAVFYVFAGFIAILFVILGYYLTRK